MLILPARQQPHRQGVNQTGGSPVPTRLPLTRRDWPQALTELAQQLDDGRIYDRDLSGLSVALDAVLEAYNRRPYVRLRAADERRAI
jgi:hypothetical protein